MHIAPVEMYVSGWGGGSRAATSFEGGIYMASNLANSTAIWTCELKEPGKFLGYHGSVEHLRGFLEESGASYHVMDENHLWWLNDLCPHEALPQYKSKKPIMRQYFRLVTSSVDVWYEKDSTPNPKGVKPQHWTKVVAGSKFDVGINNIINNNNNN